MTDRLLLQKYSDWSIVLMESFNAKRRFGFVLNSSRNLYKMLWKEDVRVVSMSTKTWNRFVGAFYSVVMRYLKSIKIYNFDMILYLKSII